MSTTYWKLENDLCRCCHSEGSFQLLSASSITDEKEEMYSDMLRNVLDIDITPVEGPLVTSAYTICTNCIERLQDASNFKKQVLQCEEKFKDMISRDLYKAPAIETKIEVPVKEEKFDEVEVDLELLSHEYNMNYDISEEKDEEGDDNREETQAIEDTSVIEDTTAIEEANVKQENKRSLRARKTKQKDPSAKKAKKAKASPSNFAEKAAKGSETIYDPHYKIIEAAEGSKEYECQTCKRTFKRLALFQQHYKHVHLKLRPKLRSCFYCDVKVPSYMRARHMEQAHGVPAPRCGACDKIFSYPFQLYNCTFCYKYLKFSNDQNSIRKFHNIKKARRARKDRCIHTNKSPKDLTTTFTQIEEGFKTCYRCNMCGFLNKTIAQMKTHVLGVHYNARTYKCPLCSDQFTALSLKNKHLAEVHGMEEVEVDNRKTLRKVEKCKCDVCKKKFPHKYSIAKHIQAVHRLFECAECKETHVLLKKGKNYNIIEEDDKPEFICNECGEIKHSIKDIHKHIILHHSEYCPYECMYCGKIFKFLRYRTRHIATWHATEEIKKIRKKALKNATMRVCGTCNMEFPSLVLFRMHFNQKHKMYKCPYCAEKFTQHQLYAHKNKNHADKMHKCGLCDFKSFTPAGIVKHQRKTHLKERNVPCPQCDAMFFDNHALHRHEVRHNPVKVFNCSFCEKKFARKNTLRQHEKIHTGNKKKVCPVCDEKFVQKASLNYHMTKYHPEAC